MSARRRHQHDERGIALITVLIALGVLLALAVTVLNFASDSRTISRHDQNWNAALNSAEAGVDDYLFHLNENSGYSDYNATNLPPDGNRAFSGFVPVPGGSTDGEYTYSVNTDNLATDGTITIRSTGRVRNSERTIQTILRRRNFLDYIYFTDYETRDPAAYTGSPFTATEAQTACALHYYEGRDPRCTEIVFISGDVINGPMHTNDAFKLCGTPRFNGNTSTSWDPASGNRWRDGCPTSNPTFANAGDPKYIAPLTMPPSNAAIRGQTSPSLGGCLYTGPTRIRLLSGGQMTVKSPFSLDTRNGCPTNGTGSLPRNGVIFVQNVPSSSSDPNYTAGCPFSVNGRAHPLGLPIANDVTTYGCRNGDVFVEGTLKGQLTIAADDNIVATHSLLYKDGLAGRDLLGLVANNYVEVWHPVRCASGSSSSCNLDANFPGESATGTPNTNPTIQAAILSVNHSFRVQNYAVGSALGSLSVDGSIAQRYRGIVGTTSSGSVVTGFSKNYRYDRRLKYLSPPKFLDPVASAWAIAVWKEIPNP